MLSFWFSKYASIYPRKYTYSYKERISNLSSCFTLYGILLDIDISTWFSHNLHKRLSVSSDRKIQIQDPQILSYLLSIRKLVKGVET